RSANRWHSWAGSRARTLDRGSWLASAGLRNHRGCTGGRMLPFSAGLFLEYRPRPQVLDGDLQLVVVESLARRGLVALVVAQVAIVVFLAQKPLFDRRRRGGGLDEHVGRDALVLDRPPTGREIA